MEKAVKLRLCSRLQRHRKLLCSNLLCKSLLCCSLLCSSLVLLRSVRCLVSKKLEVWRRCKLQRLVKSRRTPS